MIVVDTNIIAYLYLENPRTAAVTRLFARDPDWQAPLLWRSEMRNVLAVQVARRALALDQALDIQREAEDLLAGCEYEVDSPSVLRLAVVSGCSAYDCEFVALAEALAIRFITADAKLVKAFPRIASALVAG